MSQHTLKTQTNQHWSTTRQSSVFNIYMSDIPFPPKDIQITTYADDITIIAFHTKYCKAQQLTQPYLHKIYESDFHALLNVCLMYIAYT